MLRYYNLEYSDLNNRLKCKKDVATLMLTNETANY